MFKLIAWSIILALSLFCAGLVFLNRSLPKIQEFIFVAVSGMLVIILGIVFYPENTLDKNISQILFVSLKEKKPIFPNAPILTQYFFPQDITWSDCKSADSNKTKQTLLQIPDDFTLLIDLQAVSLLHYLSIAYGNNWNVQRAKKYFIPMPGFPSVGGVARLLGPVGINKTIFTKKRPS